MTSISISTYTIRVAEKHKRHSKTLSKLEGGVDLLELLHEALKACQSVPPQLTQTIKQFSVTDDLNLNGRVLDGVAEIGNHGYRSELRDIRSNNLSYARKLTDAEMIPLYFRIFIPSGSKYGIMALQNFSEVGCKTAITEIFMNVLDKKFPGYSLRIREAVTADAVDNLLSGGFVKELRFINYGIPGDIADRLNTSKQTEEFSETEIRVRAKRHEEIGLKGYARKLFSQSAESNIFELDHFKADQTKVLIEVNGREKLISYKDFAKVNSKLDVTDTVEISPTTGHPIRKSITEISSAIIMKIDKELNKEND